MIKPMRQSLALRTSRSKARLSNTKVQMAKAEEIAISGLKIKRASDDPSRWPEISALQDALEDQTSYLGNVDRVESLLDTADQTLGMATNLMSRAREMAVQLTNEIYSGVDRAAAANEINTLRSQLIEVANTEMNGRYLFAGTAYDNEAFTDAGVYSGNNNVPETKIGNNSSLRTGWDGQEVFQGTTDIFQVLDDLSAALAANDIVAVRDTLVGLDGGLEQVIAWRSEIGFGQAAATDARDIAANMKQLLQERKAEAVEEDPAVAFTKLAELRVTYETTLQVTAATSRSKLFDFIR